MSKRRTLNVDANEDAEAAIIFKRALLRRALSLKSGNKKYGKLFPVRKLPPVQVLK
jgi:hypothetical protein